MSENNHDKPLSETELAKLREIKDAWDKVHTAVMFLCALGRFIKWIATLGAAVAAIFAGLHYRGH